MRPYLILTCSDGQHGDFLVRHWLRSLMENVDLSQIDVAIIDYGLTSSQLEVLRQHVIIIPGNRQGLVVNSRFIDAKRFLKSRKYDQILSVDGGDIIFQSDISPMFHSHPDSFRAVKQDINHLYFERYINLQFRGEIRQRLWQALKGKPVINAGVIFAPVSLFIQLCEQIQKLADPLKKGSDQIIVNYFLHTHGLHLIDKQYNFMLPTDQEGYILRHGKYLNSSGGTIAVVHNAGGVDLLRPIANFGYGSGYNRRKALIGSSIRFVLALSEAIGKLITPLKS